MTRVLMAMHFRDPQDPTKYQDMHDQIHLDEKLDFYSRLNSNPKTRIFKTQNNSFSSISNSNQHAFNHTSQYHMGTYAY